MGKKCTMVEIWQNPIKFKCRYTLVPVGDKLFLLPRVASTVAHISKWVDQKTMVHLHNGILCSAKKEGAPTLCDSMDGTREHYAKWNKPGGERQIPYDLTCKWNLINKIKKWAK